MKYLSLILICCAAKCEHVGNKYFVVEMPKENLQQQNVKDFKKPFQVYWNVPTMQCASKKIPFTNLYEKFGIIQNDNDQFIGNKIVIMYNEIDFPAIIYDKTSGKQILKNGGVPQEGNLEKHLIAFENDLNKKIPDPYFDGIAVIDFESWRPVFLQNFGSLVPHRHRSIEIEKELHNWWPKMWILREASLRFESASRRFMQTTLSMAKEMRPNALWGYYGFPHCFNMRGRDMTEKCVKDMDKENDSIYWLWAESTALFPSLYSSVSLSSSQLSSLIKGRVKETSRVRGRDTPIFPYFWFRYRDAGFLTEEDLEVVLTTLYQSNVSGFIIWGGSNDVNTIEKCNKLFNYVETVLGPKIAKFTKQTKRSHSNDIENGEIESNKISRVYDDFNTDKISTTEISTDYNKYINTEESSQTFINDRMSSTDSSITYNVYSDSDDSQILIKDYLSVSLSETMTTPSEYMDTHKNIKALYEEETSSTEPVTNNEHTYPDETLQTLNNVDLLSSLSETLNFSESINIDPISQNKNDNNMPLSAISSISISNIGESLKTLNNDIPRKDTLIIYNQYWDNKDNLQAENNNEVSTQPPTTDVFNSNTLNSDGMTVSTIPTIYISDIDDISQTSKDHVSKEDTPIVCGQYFITNEKLQTVNDDDVISSSETSNDVVNSGISTVTENSNELSSINTSTPSEHIRTSQEILNNKEISSKKTSAIYNNFVYEELSNENLSNIKFLELNELSSTDESTNILIDSQITSEKNELEPSIDISYYNNMLLHSSEDRFDYLIKIDNLTDIENKKHPEYIESTNVDDDYLIIVQKFNEPSSKTSNKDIQSETDNNLKTRTKSEHLSEMVNNLDMVLKEVTNENDQDFPSYEYDESSDNIDLLNASEDRSDYLILVDNSTNIETYSQSEHTNITNTDNDYLIIVRDVSNEIYDKDNILDNKFEDLYSTTQLEADFVDIKTKDFVETSKDIDPVIEYINKAVQNMKLQDSMSAGDEPLDETLNSNEDGSDYLIKIDSSRDKETSKQFENRESTNVDDDYLITVHNIDHNKLVEHPPTPLKEAIVTATSENYDFSELSEDLDEDDIFL